MLLYIAGPLRGRTQKEIEKNIERARDVAIQIWESGHQAHCPHLNTLWGTTQCKLKGDDYIRGDLLILERCDGLVLLPGSERSEGAMKEYCHAYNRKMPIWFYPDLPEGE